MGTPPKKQNKKKHIEIVNSLDKWIEIVSSLHLTVAKGSLRLNFAFPYVDSPI